ncbi:MAG: DUF5678 domain-containing protein [archaeon]
MKKDKDLDFLFKNDLSKYSGKWVAISNRKIVSSGRNIKNTMTQARKKSRSKETLYAKIPAKNQSLIL